MRWLPPSIRWRQSWRWSDRPMPLRMRSACEPTWRLTPLSTAAPRRCWTQTGRTASPYVYRTATGYATLDLAVPSYNIETQSWVTAPLAANASVWTDPYFDAGGGEIWMITRSVPARDAEGVFALVTTDLPVDAPAQ